MHEGKNPKLQLNAVNAHFVVICSYCTHSYLPAPALFIFMD